MNTRNKREKAKRIAPGKPRQKLTVDGIRPGHRGYWAKPEQFEEMLAGGYTFVGREGVEVGTTGNGNTDLGSIVSQSAGSGDDRLYLMEISKEWYDENQKVMYDEIDETERQIFNENPGGEHAYVPGKNSSKTGRVM